MLLRTVKARRLLEYEPDVLMKTLPHSFNLQFDDGEILLTTKNKTIYSRLYWELFKYFPMAIIKEYHSTVFLGDKVPNAKTHNDIWSKLAWDVIDYYKFNLPLQRDVVLEKVTELHSDYLYKNLAMLTPGFAPTLSATDLQEIFYDQRIIDIRKNTEPNYESLEAAASSILNLVKTDNKFKLNNVARSLDTGMINPAQLRELVANCGVRSDIDGSIIPWYVMECYYGGINHPISRMVDYRTATQAMKAADAGLKDAAYKSRVISLLTSAVGSLKYGDCGSTHYRDWHVQPSCEVAGEKYPGDFKMLVGKYFLDEEIKAIRPITKADIHLIGKVIKLRHVDGCMYHDQHHFCSTCFGKLADNVGPGEALGWKCTVEVMAILIQRQLSAKHNIASASSNAIILNPSTKRFFKVSADGRSYVLLDNLMGLSPKLVLPASFSTGLLDIISSDKPVAIFDLTKAGELTYVGINLTENNQDTLHRVTVNNQKTKAVLTYELLNHIRQVGFTTDKKSNMIVDLAGFNSNSPLLTVPSSTFNPAAFTEEFARTLESSRTKMSELRKDGQAALLLTEIFRLVNMRLQIPLSVIEAIVYGLTVADDKGSMMLGRGNPNPGVGVADSLTNERSASVQLGYEQSHKALLDPIMYSFVNKPDSLYDVLIRPEEVVNNPLHFNNYNNRFDQELR